MKKWVSEWVKVFEQLMLIRASRSSNHTAKLNLYNMSKWGCSKIVLMVIFDNDNQGSVVAVGNHDYQARSNYDCYK